MSLAYELPEKALVGLVRALLATSVLQTVVDASVSFDDVFQSVFVPSGAAAVGRLQRARGDATWFRHRDAFDARKSIEAAGELLAYLLETCGSLSEAIGAYNTGRCRSNAFSRAVLRLAAAIRFVTETEPRS